MKHLLYAFISLACTILVCRHIVADIRQEERIVVLENQMKVLQYNKPTDPAFKADTASTIKKSRKEQQKFKQPIRMELNTVDSATLTKVPGIGEKSAGMIVRYREQLGGFYSVRQLEEKLTWDSAKDRMEEWCSRWFSADSSLIRPINVNTADFRQILRHPYISYEQTKALVNYRDKHKRIEGWDSIYMMEQFGDDDIQRLRFYLTF